MTVSLCGVSPLMPFFIKSLDYDYKLGLALRYFMYSSGPYVY